MRSRWGRGDSARRCMFLEKLLPQAHKGHGIYLGRRSCFLLFCMECNVNDGLMMSCCAEGCASRGDDPAVVSEAGLPQPWSCMEELARNLMSAFDGHLCPSVISVSVQGSIHHLSLVVMSSLAVPPASRAARRRCERVLSPFPSLCFMEPFPRGPL